MTWSPRRWARTPTDRLVARIFITGSSDGLGLGAARTLIDGGHTVVAHARSEQRAAETHERLPGAEDVLVADLADARATENLARAANESGTFDAVIHNAAVGNREPRRLGSADGHSHMLAINVLAPYILTARMHRPQRLIYLSSGLHAGGDSSLRDIEWTERAWNGLQAYSDSKLFDVTLALAIARLWPDVRSNAVTPGWVATKMGGAGAPDDLTLGHVTQAWLAAGEDPAADITGAYLYHQQPTESAPAARDPRFQDALLAELHRLTGVVLPDA